MYAKIHSDAPSFFGYKCPHSDECNNNFQLRQNNSYLFLRNIQKGTKIIILVLF